LLPLIRRLDVGIDREAPAQASRPKAERLGQDLQVHTLALGPELDATGSHPDITQELGITVIDTEFFDREPPRVTLDASGLDRDFLPVVRHLQLETLQRPTWFAR